jgi:hypothetical protein
MPAALDELDKSGSLLPEQENLLLPSHFYAKKNRDGPPQQPDKSYPSLAAIEGQLREGYL